MRFLRIALAVAFFTSALFTSAPHLASADVDTNTKPPAGIQATTKTLADVLTVAAKAEGKPLTSFATRIEEWSYSGSGIEGSDRTVWKGEDFKSVSHAGRLATQEGRIGGVRWEQNVNGITVLVSGVHKEADDFRAALKAARAGSPGDAVKLLGEVSSPVEAYVIEVRPAGDPPTWLFVDKASGLEVRRESLYDGVRSTTTFSDFRTISGSVVAGKSFTTDGDSVSDETRTLTSLRVNVPVSAADVNLSPTQRNLVQFPAGATSVQLPARLPNPSDMVLLDKDLAAPSTAFKRHIVVRVTINGRGLDFALDSGASNILIDSDVASELGLQRYGQNGQILQGHAGGSHVVIPEMHIGDLVMKDIVAFDLPWNMRTTDTEKVVGLLGFDFIASVGLKVDWDTGQVIAYPPGTMPMPETSVTLPLMLDDYVPDVSVSVGDAASDHFIVDTGASDVIIFPDFAAAHPSELRDEGMGRRIQVFVPELYMGVVGGVTKAIPVQAKRIVFGVPFTEFLVDVIEPGTQFGGQDMDGLIGYPFLHYFNLYFDYPSSRIVLEPNQAYRNARKVPPHP